MRLETKKKVYLAVFSQGICSRCGKDLVPPPLISLYSNETIIKSPSYFSQLLRPEKTTLLLFFCLVREINCDVDNGIEKKSRVGKKKINGKCTMPWSQLEKQTYVLQ